jgi:ATP-dependent protease ClpP protease subunit
MSWSFLLKEQGETLAIDVYGLVGESWWQESTSAANVRRSIKNSKASTIQLRINSDGGDIIDGLAIYNQLNDHPARVEVTIDGIAASAASLIAMAGDVVRMGAGAWLMIHNAWGGTQGEPDDLRRWADVLEKMSADAAQIYATRTGLSVDKVSEMMDAETWLTAEEAKAMGFATEVIPAKAKAVAKALVQGATATRGGAYHNVPELLKAQLGAKSSRAAKEQPNLDLFPENKETNMTLFKTLAAFLGIVEGADEPTALNVATKKFEAGNAALALLAKFEAATGKKGEEALGAALAWKASHEKVGGLETELKTSREAQQKTELEAFLSGARDGSAFEDKQPRLTKAEADKLQAQITSGELSLAAAKSFVEVKAPISHLSKKVGQGNNGENSSSLQGSAKSYRNMTNMERARLEQSDPEEFARLRREWEREGCPEPEATAA